MLVYQWNNLQDENADMALFSWQMSAAPNREIIHRRLRFFPRTYVCIPKRKRIEDVEQVGLQLQFHLEFMVDI